MRGGCFDSASPHFFKNRNIQNQGYSHNSHHQENQAHHSHIAFFYQKHVQRISQAGNQNYSCGFPDILFCLCCKVEKAEDRNHQDSKISHQIGDGKKFMAVDVFHGLTSSPPNETIIPFLDGNTNGKMVCLTNILKNPMIVGRCFGIGSKEDIMKEKHLDLCRDSVNSVFFQFLIPSIGATLVNSIYILGDTILVGRGVGSMGIAALNLLLPVFSLFFATGMLFGVGGSVLFSFDKGRKDETAAREHFSAALVGTVLMAVFYELVCGLFFDPITAFLGRNEAMDEMVRSYGRILTAGCPVFLLSSFLQAFVRNDRAPRVAMAAVIAGGVSNVILDYIFMFPMKMGMAGGALATVLGSVITVVILLSHFFSSSNTLKFTRHFHWKTIGEVALNGLSSFILDLSSGVVILLFNRQLLYWIGDMGVMVYGIVSNSVLVVNSISNGISQASQPLMAVNNGAGLLERVNQTFRLARRFSVGTGILFTALGLLVPALVVRVFVSPTPEILAMAVPAVRIYFLAFLATGINLLLATYFQSVLMPACALILSLCRGVIFSGILVYLLPLLVGVEGIWAAMPVAELLALILGILMKKRGKRQSS